MQKKEEVMSLIEKALIKPKSLLELKHELHKDEKIIRSYLKEMSDKVFYEPLKREGRVIKVFSLKNDIKEVVTQELNKQFDENLTNSVTTDEYKLQEIRTKYLNSDELDILNWKEEEDW